MTERTQCYATGWGVADIGIGVKGKLVYVYKDKLQVLALTVLNRLACSIRCQFHQNFMRAFLANILLPKKIMKPKRN